MSEIWDSPLCYNDLMKLYVARHGQTNYNDLGLCNSDPKTDVHLTDVGLKQAQDLADKLKTEKIDQVIVSELRRTQQTAGIVNQYHNAPVAVDPRLNDNRTGYEDRDAKEYYSALDSADDKWNVRLNDGESIEDVKLRVKEFLDELKAKDYESVLIVTYMVIIQIICGILNGLDNQQAWDLPIDKASCTELEL